MTNKVEEFYNTLVKDPDLDIKAGQTRQQAARQEAEYRARQYNNNVQALALANEPAQVESPINSLFNHLEQMKKSMPDTALIKGIEDITQETRDALKQDVDNQNKDITESNTLVESNTKTIEEKKARFETLDKKDELKIEEVEEKENILGEIKALESSNTEAQQKLEAAQRRLQDISAGLKSSFSDLTDEDITTLTGLTAQPPQKGTTPEPEQTGGGEKSEQSTNNENNNQNNNENAPSIDARTANAARNYFGKERFDELFAAGELNNLDMAAIKEKFPNEGQNLTSNESNNQNNNESNNEKDAQALANTLPHDNARFVTGYKNDPDRTKEEGGFISEVYVRNDEDRVYNKNWAEEGVIELLAHQDRHGKNMGEKAKKQLNDLLTTYKEMGADFDKIEADKEKHGENFGGPEHLEEVKNRNKMDGLINTAKQNQKDENGEEIEESSLFDHLYNRTHGDNPFGDTKEEFEQSLRTENLTKLKTKFRTEYTKLQTSREREQEQKEIKRQAQQKEEGNTLPHDESDFKDISENDATQLATEMVAHNQKYKHTLSPASKKKLDKILEEAKKAGADLEKIGEDREKLGDKFGSEEHYKDLAEHHAEKEKQATLERHATGDDDEAIQARRRAGMEASQSAKDFHHGDDLNTKSRMSQSKEGNAENFGHSRHKKTTGAPASSNMPPAMREIMEEQNKDKPNKELIRENKDFLAQKASEGYKWHPDTKHWVHEEGLNSLLGSHKGNAGTLLDGQHQVKGHPPTLLNGDGSTSNKKVLYSQGGLQNFGGDSITGKALEHSFKNGSFKSQHAATSAGGKNGIKLNNVSSHTNFAGITTQATLKPTATTRFQAGEQRGRDFVRNFKTPSLDGLKGKFFGKSEYPYDYPSAIETLSKNYKNLV
jgi:hypothetical protein